MSLLEHSFQRQIRRVEWLRSSVRDKRISRGIHTQMTCSFHSRPLRCSLSRERSPVAIATRKTARRRRRLPWALRGVLVSFRGWWSRHERWAACYATAGLRWFGARPKFPCIGTQETWLANVLAGRREMRRGTRERSSGSMTHWCACTNTRHVALVAPTLETRDSRFISFFALEKVDFSGIRLRSTLRIRKRARFSRVLFNLAYTDAPLRSAARRFVLLLQRGKAASGRRVFPIDRT